MPTRPVATIVVVILVSALAMSGVAGHTTQQFTVYIDHAYATEVQAGEPIDLEVTILNDGEDKREVTVETISTSDHIKSANETVRIKSKNGKTVTMDIPTNEEGNGKYIIEIQLKKGDTLLDRQEVETSIGLVDDEDEDNGGDSGGDDDEGGEDEGEFDEGGNAEVADSLGGVLVLIIGVGEPLGFIVFFVGLMFWGAGIGGQRTSRGKRLVFVGSLIVIVTLGAPTIANFFKYLVPYTIF
jgi:hypothetical protein